MTTLQIVVLALVQGITEFLPISSSGHLILVPVLTDWPDQGLLFDVAVHVGSLGAVLIYFRRDVLQMLQGVPALMQPNRLDNPRTRILLLVVIGTVPVVAAGILLKAFGADVLRSAEVIGWTMLVFGVVLYLVDRWQPDDALLERMTLGGALVVGLAQVLALIPGTSRAGITITAARWLGYRRDEAARFSMLLSIPTILAAGGLLTLDVVEAGDLEVGQDVLLATGLAFVSAWAAIALMMHWLQRASYTPFVVYRCLLGVALLVYAYA